MVKSVRALLQGEVIILHPSQAENVTGLSAVFEVSRLKYMPAGFGAFVIDVTAASGTTPTLDVTIVNVDPVSGKEDVLVTFTQRTAAATQWKYACDTGKVMGNYIRAKWTIGGTTPSFTFTITGHLKP